MTDLAPVAPPTPLYTPAPWAAITTRFGWLVAVKPGVRWSCGVAKYQNHEADARLMAAAPDLLLAVKALLARVPTSAHPTHEFAIAAIAKAEGTR